MFAITCIGGQRWKFTALRATRTSTSKHWLSSKHGNLLKCCVFYCIATPPPPVQLNKIAWFQFVTKIEHGTCICNAAQNQDTYMLHVPILCCWEEHRGYWRRYTDTPRHRSAGYYESLEMTVYCYPLSNKHHLSTSDKLESAIHLHGMLKSFDFPKALHRLMLAAIWSVSVGDLQQEFSQFQLFMHILIPV